MARSDVTAPTTSAAGTPSMTTATTGGGMTVMLAARAQPPASATTTATPRRFAASVPSSVTEATAGLREAHRTAVPIGRPCRSSARADSGVLVPALTSPGTSTSMVTTSGTTMTTSTAFRTGPADTVIVAVPAAFAVTTPAASTTAMLAFDDSHVSRAVSTAAPLSVRGVAGSTTQSPTSVVQGGWSMSMDVIAARAGRSRAAPDGGREG